MMYFEDVMLRIDSSSFSWNFLVIVFITLISITHAADDIPECFQMLHFSVIF